MQKVRHSPTSPPSSDSIPQLSRTASAEQASRSDPEKDGATPRATRTTQRSGNLARPDRGLDTAWPHVRPGQCLVRSECRLLMVLRLTAHPSMAPFRPTAAAGVTLAPARVADT